MSLKVLLGNLEFYENKKEFIDISPFLESKDITISETSNNVIPTITGMTYSFFNNSYLMSETEGLTDFLDKNKDFSIFPLIVILDDEVLFNGYIEKSKANFQQGLGFNDNEVYSYDIDVIHKSSELNSKYITRILSYQNINSKKYFNYLFETNQRITKYNQIESDLDVESDYTLSELVLLKSQISKYSTIKVGDPIHRINTLDGIEVKESYIINSIKNFKDYSSGQFVKSLDILNFDSISENMIINVNGSNIDIYINSTLVASGTIENNIGTFSEISSSGISGTIEFTDDYFLQDLDFNWGDSVSWLWGEDVDWIWGLGGNSFAISTNRITIETMENINVYENTSSIRTKIGFYVDVLDESANTEIANPTIKFKTAASLVDDLSSSYLFNYKFDDYGNIKLYTNTIEDLEDADHILQIGNSSEELLDVDSVNIYNCITEDGINFENSANEESDFDWGNNVPWLWGAEVNFNWGDFPESYIEYISIGLTEGKKYAVYIDTDGDIESFKYDNSDDVLEYEELEYSYGRYYIFTLPEGANNLIIRVTNPENSKKFYINSISIKEILYTENELNSIFKLNSFDFDATGLKTALHIPNYLQVEYAETIEQIDVYSPAENTYHRIDDEAYNLSETISTGSEESIYYKLGQGIDYLEFPIIIDDSTFIKSVNLNMYRNNLSDEQCVFVNFYRNNTTNVFSEIIPSENISDSTLTLSPIFLYKKDDESFTCKLEKKEFEQKSISSNVFSTSYPDDYNIGDIINIAIDGVLKICEVSGVLDNDVSFDILDSNGDPTGEIVDESSTYIVRDSDNDISSSEFIELEATNIFDDGEDYLDVSGEIGTSITLIKEMEIQNSWVTRYPVSNIGDDYNGSPNVLLLRGDNSDTFYVVDTDNNSSTGETFMNNNSDFFSKLLEFDLVYIEVYNSSTGEWEVVRIKSFSSGQITLYREIDLSNYGTGVNNLVQFRRVYITKTVDFGTKDEDDEYYEAYMTSSRNSFGFNLSIDQDAVDGLSNGNMYLIGNILSGIYKISYEFPRYSENSVKSSIYGYFEDVYTESMDDLQTYATLTSNELDYVSEPILTADIDIHYEFFNTVMTDKNLKNIQLVKIYHDRLPGGYALFSVEEKTWNRVKSGRIILNMKLEKVVG